MTRHAPATRSLAEIVAVMGLAGFGATLGVHFAIGYTDPLHLAPAYAGCVLFAAAVVQPTRRQQRRIVVLKALSALAALVLARASPLIAGSDMPAPQDTPDAFASAETRVAVPAGSDQTCFPVSMDVGTDGVEEHDGYVEGWAFIDRAAHFEGRTCQVKGWVSMNPCGRRITAYMANCPDGALDRKSTRL